MCRELLRLAWTAYMYDGRGCHGSPTRISKAEQPDGMSSGKGPTGAPNSTPVSGISGHVCARTATIHRSAATSVERAKRVILMLEEMWKSSEDGNLVLLYAARLPASFILAIQCKETEACCHSHCFYQSILPYFHLLDVTPQ